MLHSRETWHRTAESNREPSAWDAAAVPIEPARQRCWWVRMDSNHRVLEGRLLYRQLQSASLPRTRHGYLVRDAGRARHAGFHFGCARARAAAARLGTPEVERMTSLELVASAMAWPRSAC